MFSFLSMMGNYEDRKVARFEADWGFISTAQVNYGSKPYETAVAHEDYNDGKIIIVESYGTRELALAGHERWIKTMTAKKLPDSLTDCCNAGIGEVASKLGADMTYPRKK